MRPAGYFCTHILLTLSPRLFRPTHCVVLRPLCDTEHSSLSIVGGKWGRMTRSRWANPIFATSKRLERRSKPHRHSLQLQCPLFSGVKVLATRISGLTEQHESLTMQRATQSEQPRVPFFSCWCDTAVGEEASFDRPPSERHRQANFTERRRTRISRPSALSWVIRQRSSARRTGEGKKLPTTFLTADDAVLFRLRR